MPVVAASRLTRKYQATIPADVRRALRLKQGDTVQFEIEGARHLDVARLDPGEGRGVAVALHHGPGGGADGRKLPPYCSDTSTPSKRT